jgi:hypothetical protein
MYCSCFISFQAWPCGLCWHYCVILGRYKRRTQEIDDAIVEAYVKALSARKMETGEGQPVGGEGAAPSTIVFRALFAEDIFTAAELNWRHQDVQDRRSVAREG